MRDIAEMSIIHIDVTNACHLRCANCTRHMGHHKKTFFMDLEFVEKAIDSLEGFPGQIGLMGGEPFLHPKIKEIIAVFFLSLYVILICLINLINHHHFLNIFQALFN